MCLNHKHFSSWGFDHMWTLNSETYHTISSYWWVLSSHLIAVMDSRVVLLPCFVFHTLLTDYQKGELAKFQRSWCAGSVSELVGVILCMEASYLTGEQRKNPSISRFNITYVYNINKNTNNNNNRINKRIIDSENVHNNREWKSFPSI